MIAPILPHRHRLRACGWLAAAVFALLVARFWDPCYGFTKFLQFDSTDAPIAIPEMRRDPVYVYPGSDGYDGYSYAEISYHPLLGSPALKSAIGNLPYRARRILGSAIAWAAAGGSEGEAAARFALLNLFVWPLFALLAWRLLPVRDGRSYCVWLGLVFSAGALHSVRLALTDLLGVTLFAAAMLLAEKRRRSSLWLLALGGLARETIVAFVPAWWRGPWNSARAWAANLAKLIGVALPIAAWVIYVRCKAGPAPQGLGNFTWPVTGWAHKWGELFSDFSRQPQFALVEAASLLALIGLTAQAAYFFVRPRPGNAWWRAGVVGLLLMALFGTAVWEGHPGAAYRVLLPMTFAYAVLVVRDGAGPAWVAAGMLSMASGFLALGNVPEHPLELATGRTHEMRYVITLGDGWFGCERTSRHTWAWTAQRGTLDLRTWHAGAGPVTLRLGLRALSPRTVQIRCGDQVLWRGNVATKVTRIEFAGTARTGSQLTVETTAPPVTEGERTGARSLGIAVYDPSMVESGS